MPKVSIARDELRRRVLAEIRRHPGCGTVKEIAITPMEIVDVGHTWHVNIIDGGESDMTLAASVARQVQERLVAVFDVID